MVKQNNRSADERNKPTADGLAFLIWMALDALRSNKCSKSDCKEAINHLIRAYGHHKTLTWGESFFHSRKFFDEFNELKTSESRRKTYLEHVIPIKVIMNILIDHVLTEEIKDKHGVVSYLGELLIICRVTEDEEKALRQKKLVSKMHASLEMSYPRIKEQKFIRYTACEPNILHISEIDHWCDVPRTRLKINRSTPKST